jgi:hypothetical protein
MNLGGDDDFRPHQFSELADQMRPPDIWRAAKFAQLANEPEHRPHITKFHLISHAAHYGQNCRQSHAEITRVLTTQTSIFAVFFARSSLIIAFYPFAQHVIPLQVTFQAALLVFARAHR